MFQTFTGSSRRPRQVNLSGRSGNPFAATGATGAKSALDSAKEERAKRQEERERITASRRIQRTWRGYHSRRKTFALWRSIWDKAEENLPQDVAYSTPEQSLAQLDRLLLFFSPKHDPNDARRLRWYGMRQVSTADKFDCQGQPWTHAYGRLQKACLMSLAATNENHDDHDDHEETLRVLAFAARRAGFTTTDDAMHYYTILTTSRSSAHDALQHALLAPLTCTTAYAGLAILLAKPLQPDMLALLKDHLDSDLLAQGLKKTISSVTTARSRLWLLGNILCLCNARTTSVTVLVAHLLSGLAGYVEFEAMPMDVDNSSFDQHVLSKAHSGLPLNTWLADQLSILVSSDSLRQISGHETSPLRASLALTLLNCYPRKADEIRMCLYMGPLNGDTAEDRPLMRFWKWTRSTSTFNRIREDSRAVVSILRSSARHKNDWIMILLFLELYAFFLKIADDDQFLGQNSSQDMSVDDIAALVTFMKHLGFALCFNAAELTDQPDATPSLSSHFGSAASEMLSTATAKPLRIVDVVSITVEDLKGTTTGILRAIYERDSRRHFLPAQHWLMTSRFDMTAFITAVVEEEEKRRSIAENDEDQAFDLLDDDVGPVTSSGGTSRHQSMASRAHAERRALTRRTVESVAPRLEILQNMPFFIPFSTRVEIFREFVMRDKISRRGGNVDADSWRATMMFHPADPGRNILARHHAQITRKQEFEDAYKQFYDLGPALKEPIQITFLDEFGLQEAGIDGGGVTKEFLTSVVSQAFDPANDGMDKYFVENQSHLLYPNPTILEDSRLLLSDTFNADNEIKPFLREILRKYEFLGRIIGKCLYEGILIDVAFAGFFLKKWALTGGFGAASGENGYRANFNDLRDFDEELYRGLLHLKNTTDASSFGLTFTVDDEIGSGDTKQIIERELMPNGGNIAVTNENRLIYINRLSWYRLQGQSEAQTSAFLKGLSSMIQPSWLSMFNQNELQTLIGGAHSGIDVQDLRRNTQYGGTYVIGDDGEEHPSVQLFWKIMESLADEDRRKVLKFVTSTPRGPLLGFTHLTPRFSIRDSGSDENRFPTTSTCVNLLKLPMYRSEAMMRRKLLEAVNSGAGFDLS